jgi:hypothetical protein
MIRIDQIVGSRQVGNRDTVLLRDARERLARLHHVHCRRILLRRSRKGHDNDWTPHRQPQRDKPDSHAPQPGLASGAAC